MVGSHSSDAPRALGLASQLYLDHCAEELCGALDAGGVGAILLKGPAVARVLYATEERRYYGDIDLLIDPPHAENARRILAALGYRPRFPGAGLAEAGIYAEEYARKSALVDLHLSYPGITVEPGTAWRELRAHAEQVPFRSGAATMLRAEGVAVILALHAAKSPGRPVGDLGRAIERFGDPTWGAAIELAVRLGALGMVAVGLGRTLEGVALLDRLGIDAELSTEARLLASNPPPLALGLERLATTPGARAKMRMAARELVPSPDGLRYWSSLARSGRAGVVIAYVWRPFWLLRRLPRAIAAWRWARQTSGPDPREGPTAGPSGRPPR